MVVAHCDDETIGASHQLLRGHHDAQILHVTDSAPLDPVYAQRAGFATRQAYAKVRRQEMLAAMSRIGIRATQCHVLAIPDQEAPRRIAEIAAAVEHLVAKGGITRVFTHAFEGGHPDHDACALAVHIALRVRRGVRLFEMPFYHAAGGPMIAAQFLPHPDAGKVIDKSLSLANTIRRQTMFKCFPTQAHVFERFPIAREPYRLAPHHDFRQPPHALPLYYETRPLNWTWPAWHQATAPAISHFLDNRKR